MAAPSINPIIPKLELHKLRDDELDEYAQEKIDRINAINAGLPVIENMLFEDGEKMLYEDGEEMEYE